MSAMQRQPYLWSLERDTEQNNRRKTFLDQWCKETFELVHTPSALSWHRSEFNLGIIIIISDKDGIHKHGLGDVSTLVLPCPGDGMLVSGVQD